jgi:hypothetical protein
VTRREQADSLLLEAISHFENDPHGQVSILRALTMATIANAMLQQEALDSTIEMGLDEDDPDDPTVGSGGNPW